MNAKKGIFRLTVVFSVLVGVSASILVFSGTSDDLKLGLQLHRNKELSEEQDKYDLDKRKTESINEAISDETHFHWPEPYGDYLTPELLRGKEQEIEHLKRDITFWSVVYKSLWFLLPISGFLIGSLSVWVVYYIFFYTIRYVGAGFVAKGKEKAIEEEPCEKRIGIKCTLQKLKQKKLIVILALAVIMILIVSLISFLNLEEQNNLDGRLKYSEYLQKQLSTTNQRVEKDIPFDDKSLIDGNAGVNIIGHFSGSIYNGSKWTITKLKFKVVAKNKNGGVRWTRYFVNDFSYLEPLTAESFSVYAGDTNVTSCDWYIDQAWGYIPDNK